MAMEHLKIIGTTLILVIVALKIIPKDVVEECRNLAGRQEII